MNISRGGGGPRLVVVVALCALGLIPVVAMAGAPPTEPPTSSSESTLPDTTEVSLSAPGTTGDSTTTSLPPTNDEPSSTVTETTAIATTTVVATTTASPAVTAAPTTTVSSVVVDAASPSPLAVPTSTPTVSDVRATQSTEDSGDRRIRTVTLTWTGTAEYYWVARRFAPPGTPADPFAWDLVVYDAGSSPVQDRFEEDTDTSGWYEYRVSPYYYVFVPGPPGDHDSWYRVFGTPGYVSVFVTPVAYPPSVPESLSVTTSGTNATVSWTAPPATDSPCDATGYVVCEPATSYVVSFAAAGSSTWHSVTMRETSRTLTGLRPGTTYYVNVRAVNDGGRGPATPSARFTPVTAPGPMSPVSATPGDSQVTLQWTAPSSNGSPVTGYAIQQRRVGSSIWEYISTSTPATSRSFTAGNLTNGTTYYFRVVATNAIGRGAWSYPVEATPHAVSGNNDEQPVGADSELPATA
jgi:titin